MSNTYLTRHTAAERRIYPSRLSRSYVASTRLREAIERTVHTVIMEKPAATVVDLGCADIPYRRFFPVECLYLGVDLPGNPNASVALNPDGRADLPDECADIVFSTQVLEHVPDPAAYLRECRRLLRSGGVLILSTHGVWRYHPDPVDYWRWTGAGLRRILSAEQFQVVNVSGILTLAAIGAQLFLDGWLGRFPKWLHASFAGAMQLVIAFTNRATRSSNSEGDAGIFLCVARKP